jgi:hypothetical protein
MVFYIINYLTLEDLTAKLVSNYRPARRNIPEELIRQVQCGGNQKSIVFCLSPGLPVLQRDLLPVYLTF